MHPSKFHILLKFQKDLKPLPIRVESYSNIIIQKRANDELKTHSSKDNYLQNTLLGTGKYRNKLFSNANTLDLIKLILVLWPT